MNYTLGEANNLLGSSLLGDVKVARSCPTLCDPMDYTVHGIHQARILYWVAFPFSRESFQPRDWTQVSLIVGDSLPAEPPERTKHLGWVAYPFSSGFPNPGIEPGSPALQANSLPTELSGNIILKNFSFICIQSTLLCNNARVIQPPNRYSHY